MLHHLYTKSMLRSPPPFIHFLFFPMDARTFQRTHSIPTGSPDVVVSYLQYSQSLTLAQDLFLSTAIPFLQLRPLVPCPEGIIWDADCYQVFPLPWPLLLICLGTLNSSALAVILIITWHPWVSAFAILLATFLFLVLGDQGPNPEWHWALTAPTDFTPRIRSHVRAQDLWGTCCLQWELRRQSAPHRAMMADGGKRDAIDMICLNYWLN